MKTVESLKEVTVTPKTIESLEQTIADLEEKLKAANQSLEYSLSQTDLYQKKWLMAENELRKLAGNARCVS